MASIWDGFDTVQLSSRLPNLPLGTHEVTLVSAREHESTQGAGTGILVEVQCDGARCGWRIQLGGRYPEYGQRDFKELCAAVLGIADPAKAAVEITKAVGVSILSDEQPCTGARFEVSVSETEKTDKNGRPYRKVRCQPLPSGALPDALYRGTDQISKLVTPPPPPPPDAQAFPPSGWTQHPQSPSHYYRGSEVLSEAQLRALIAVGKAA